MSRICTVCRLVKPTTDFYRQGKHRSGACKPCFRARQARYYERDPDGCRRRNAATRARLHVIMDAVKARPCMDCGGRFPSCAMDFDHVRGQKLLAVATLAGRTVSEETLRAEIAKCDVVCANCHRIRTMQRRSDGLLNRGQCDPRTDHWLTQPALITHTSKNDDANGKTGDASVD